MGIYWTFSPSSLQRSKVFKGIYDESCEGERAFNAACTAGRKLWLAFDKKNLFLSLALPGSFGCPRYYATRVCVCVEGEKALERKERTFRNCPKWPWFILVCISCSIRIILYRIFIAIFILPTFTHFFLFSSRLFVYLVLFLPQDLFFSAGWMASACVYARSLAWRIKCETRKHKNSYYRVT